MFVSILSSIVAKLTQGGPAGDTDGHSQQQQSRNRRSKRASGHSTSTSSSEASPSYLSLSATGIFLGLLLHMVTHAAVSLYYRHAYYAHVDDPRQWPPLLSPLVLRAASTLITLLSAPLSLFSSAYARNGANSMVSGAGDPMSLASLSGDGRLGSAADIALLQALSLSPQQRTLLSSLLQSAQPGAGDASQDPAQLLAQLQASLSPAQQTALLAHAAALDDPLGATTLDHPGRLGSAWDMNEVGYGSPLLQAASPGSTMLPWSRAPGEGGRRRDGVDVAGAARRGLNGLPLAGDGDLGWAALADPRVGTDTMIWRYSAGVDLSQLQQSATTAGHGGEATWDDVPDVAYPDAESILAGPPTRCSRTTFAVTHLLCGPDAAIRQHWSPAQPQAGAAGSGRDVDYLFELREIAAWLAEGAASPQLVLRCRLRQLNAGNAGHSFVLQTLRSGKVRLFQSFIGEYSLGSYMRRHPAPMSLSQFNAFLDDLQLLIATSHATGRQDDSLPPAAVAALRRAFDVTPDRARVYFGPFHPSSPLQFELDIACTMSGGPLSSSSGAYLVSAGTTLSPEVLGELAIAMAQEARISQGREPTDRAPVASLHDQEQAAFAAASSAVDAGLASTEEAQVWAQQVITNAQRATAAALGYASPDSGLLAAASPADLGSMASTTTLASAIIALAADDILHTDDGIVASASSSSDAPDPLDNGRSRTSQKHDRPRGRMRPQIVVPMRGANES